MLGAIDRVAELEPPIQAVKRAEELGQSVGSWRELMSGGSPTNPSS